ncbi:hypothetical protein PVA38_11245 [Streptococcus pneumoniae D39]|nr:hypothetical protein PVA38_11245 [Streptococcus pneumoniae D39]
MEITNTCLLYTSDAADEARSVDLGGRRTIKKKNSTHLNTYYANRDHLYLLLFRRILTSAFLHLLYHIVK